MTGGDNSGSPDADEEAPSREDVFRRGVGKCPIATVKLGGVPVPCLLDSGSEVITITDSFFTENYHSKGSRTLLSTSRWLKLRADPICWIVRAGCQNLRNNHPKEGNPGGQGLRGPSNEKAEARSAWSTGYEYPATGEARGQELDGPYGFHIRMGRCAAVQQPASRQCTS